MRSERARDVFAFVALFSLFDGDGLRDLLSWWGFAAESFALLVVAVVVLAQERRRFRALIARPTSVPLALVLVVCLASVLWSAYPATTLGMSGVQIATTTVAVALVLARPIGRLVAIFAVMLHVNLALSVVFEVVVALLPGHRIAPFFTDYGSNAPGAFYWSQGLLFTGERIQGIVGNANLTCFLALLGAITVGCLLAAGRIRRRLAVAALALDVLMFALTRSGTVIIAAVACVGVTVLMLAYRRARRRGRLLLTVAALVLVGLTSLASSRLSEPVLRLLGKGDDLTGRLEIWRLVGSLVVRRPLQGWGWTGWWAPWTEPYRGLVVRGGVQYLQAHNAVLDIEVQVGVLGIAAFALFFGSLMFRALRLAAVRAPLTLLPLLVATALLTQALAESRLLIEGNWAALVMLSVVLPRGRSHALPPEDGERKASRSMVAAG